MAYVAARGGEAAIDAAHAWLAEVRRGDPALPAISPAQIENQLGRAVDRVMGEGSLYDPPLAARAIAQAQGDLIEAAFLVRAARTTLARFGASPPIDTAAMTLRRRISAIFKDAPGGQLLGPTTDYTHRLLDRGAAGIPPPPRAEPDPAPMPRIPDILGADALIEPDPDHGETPTDITRTPPAQPAPRDARLQALARGDEGFLLAMGYSTQRGYGHTHPFVAELRVGTVAVEIDIPELGFAVSIADITVTECQMVNQFAGTAEAAPQFSRGYGLVFGHSERRAIAMALCDRALRAAELGEPATAPAQDAEFVLSHCDTVEATGFTEHLKLPHYVDFQSELEILRALRAAHAV